MDEESLASSFLPLARSMASKYHLDREEAESEAIVALVNAAKSYDPARGSFVAYARVCISNSLNALYNDTIKRAGVIPLSRFEERRNWEEELHSKMPPQTDMTELVESMMAMKQFIQSLSPEGKLLLKLKAKGKTQRQIADSMGVSQTTVSRMMRILHQHYHEEH